MPGQGRPSEGTGARALGCAICHETSAGTPRHVPDRLRSSFPLPAPSCPEGSNGTDSKPWVQILPPPTPKPSDLHKMGKSQTLRGPRVMSPCPNATTTAISLGSSGGRMASPHLPREEAGSWALGQGGLGRAWHPGSYHWVL